MNISIRTLVMVLSLRLLLDSATSRLAEYWGYLGIVYQPVSLWLYIFSLVVLIIPLPFLYKKEWGPSSFCFQLLYIFFYIPITSQYAVNREFSMIPMLETCFCFVVLGMLIHTPNIKSKPAVPNYSHKRIIWLFISIWVLSYGLLIAKQGVPTSVPNIFNSREIYAFRETVDLGKLLSYIFTWQTLAMNILLIAFGIFRKNWVLCVSGIAMQVLSFAFSGMKFQIFGTILYLAFAYGIVKYKDHFDRFLLMFLFLGIVMAELLDYQAGLAPAVESLVARRTLVVPAQLHFVWYDYFSTHKKDYFGQNLPFKFFYDTEYENSLSVEIGSYFFNSDAPPNCNANSFIDGYANAGFLGMIFVTILLAGYLKLCERLGRNKDKILVLSCLALPMMNFGGTSFFTNLVSGGALFCCLAIWALPDSKTLT